VGSVVMEKFVVVALKATKAVDYHLVEKNVERRIINESRELRYGYILLATSFSIPRFLFPDGKI
jgi:hypothetical protein